MSTPPPRPLLIADYSYELPSDRIAVRPVAGRVIVYPLKVTFLLVCWLLPATISLSQPKASIQIGGAGLALSWVSVGAEVTAVSFSDGGFSQSLRVGAVTGLPMFNATWLPIELRYLAFQGSHHAEISTGINLQVDRRPPKENPLVDFPKSLVWPIWSAGYRYEAMSGGFLFRGYVGGLYHPVDHEMFYCAGMALGWAFN